MGGGGGSSRVGRRLWGGGCSLTTRFPKTWFCSYYKGNLKIQNTISPAKPAKPMENLEKNRNFFDFFLQNFLKFPNFFKKPIKIGAALRAAPRKKFQGFSKEKSRFH